jgi:hypothetical protein
MGLTPPEIETPQGCLAHGAIVVEPYFRTGRTVKKNIISILACSGIERGAGQKIYECHNVDEKDIDEIYLLQVKRASEAIIGATCLNCPMNPLNRSPDDLSELD